MVDRGGLQLQQIKLFVKNHDDVMKWEHFSRYWPFVTRRQVTRSFDVFFDLRLHKRLSKQWWGWWFETPLRPLWRHRNDERQVIKLRIFPFSDNLGWARKYMAGVYQYCICRWTATRSHDEKFIITIFYSCFYEWDLYFDGDVEYTSSQNIDLTSKNMSTGQYFFTRQMTSFKMAAP